MLLFCAGLYLDAIADYGPYTLCPKLERTKAPRYKTAPKDKEYTDEQKQWQLVRRGRYVPWAS